MIGASPLDAESRSVVEGLYLVFARYPLRASLECCPCCVDAADGRRLRRAPLRELSSGELAHFVWNAIDTWGGPDDFRHFLPRILELVLIEWNHRLAPFVVFEKLGRSGWESWSGDEREALQAYFRELWRATLAREPRLRPLALETLSLVAPLIDDVDVLLSNWERDDSDRAIRHLAEFVVADLGDLAKHGRANHWRWACGASRARRLDDWLIAPAMAERLEDAWLRRTEAPWADELATAADLLRSVLAMRSLMEEVQPSRPCQTSAGPDRQGWPAV